MYQGRHLYSANYGVEFEQVNACWILRLYIWKIPLHTISFIKTTKRFEGPLVLFFFVIFFLFLYAYVYIYLYLYLYLYIYIYISISIYIYLYIYISIYIYIYIYIRNLMLKGCFLPITLLTVFELYLSYYQCKDCTKE